MSVNCPDCSGQRFQIVVRMLADVTFDENGDHEVSDTYGDVEFDEDSFIICETSQGGCGWSGTLREATTKDQDEQGSNASPEMPSA